MTFARLTLLATLLLACLTAAPADARPDASRAHDQSVRARKAYDAGEFVRAANLYRLAYQLNANEPTYLYGIGKSEQMAGRCAMADKAFAELKARLPTTHPIFARTTAAEELCHPPSPVNTAPPVPAVSVVVVPVTLTPTVDEAAAAPVAVVIAPPAPPVPVNAAPILATQRTPRRSTSWTLWAGVGAGVVASATGAWAGWATADLDGQVGHMSPSDARDRQVTINGASTAAAVLGGLALAGIGHGIWSYWQGAERD